MIIGGTIEASMAALVRGWAINLGGGFHHAHYASGGGLPPSLKLLLIGD